MVNYKRIEQQLVEREHRRQYGWPATPADAVKLAKWERSQAKKGFTTNEEWKSAEDKAADEDIAEINRLMAEGRYQECEPYIKRLGQRYRVPPRPPRSQRPRCGAMTRKGEPCKAAVVWIKGEPLPRKRCRNHGGLSTGPVTEQGKQSIAESNRKRAMKGTANGRG